MMSQADRAKQFLPFAALRGFEYAIAEQEAEKEARVELDVDAVEELDRKLSRIYPGFEVSVTCYDGRRYRTLRGTVKRLIPEQHLLLLDGSRRIAFSDILDIRRN